jgi:hypothetical protein
MKTTTSYKVFDVITTNQRLFDSDCFRRAQTGDSVILKHI